MNQVLIDHTESVAPGFIFTTLGAVEEVLLEKKVIVEDFDEATSTATEYWLDGECVRRDVNLALKPKVMFEIEAKEI